MIIFAKQAGGFTWFRGHCLPRTNQDYSVFIDIFLVKKKQAKQIWPIKDEKTADIDTFVWFFLTKKTAN